MKLITTLILFFLLVGCSVDINGSNNYYLINGRNHIFKVFAPQLWTNDAEHAKSLGIASFFIPAQPFIENPKNGDLYIYAQGWDKANKDSTFEYFIQEDQKEILKKFKNVKITKKDFNFSKMNHIKNAAYFVIENIPGRFKEDCLFLETDSTIVNIVYSAANKELYDVYKDEFDKSLTKFEFLSSDPVEIKKILEKDKKERGY
jgi:hypothetical protein